eukprot:COSAG01_NODE_1544_length_9968_cov_20.144594_10_plen_176_part_00
MRGSRISISRLALEKTRRDCRQHTHTREQPPKEGRISQLGSSFLVTTSPNPRTFLTPMSIYDDVDAGAATGGGGGSDGDIVVPEWDVEKTQPQAMAGMGSGGVEAKMTITILGQQVDEKKAKTAGLCVPLRPQTISPTRPVCACSLFQVLMKLCLASQNRWPSGFYRHYLQHRLR